MIDLCVFDLETNGIDANHDPIITAYVGLLDKDGVLQREQEWIVDPRGSVHAATPDFALSAGAAEVHGWTEERLDTDPRVRHDLTEVVREIASLIWAACGPIASNPLPLAGHNVSYDLTMLNAHLHRQGVAPLPFGPGGIKVLDSIVLDKHFDRYVKGAGQRKLTPTAARYGLTLTDEQAHNASFDALAAGRICQAIIKKHMPYLAGSPVMEDSLDALHGQQARWRSEQQIDLQKWLRKTEPTAVCEPEWPSYHNPNAPHIQHRERIAA